MIVGKRGTLAYYRSAIAGPIPVKVHKVERESGGRQIIRAYVTAPRGAYRKGDDIVASGNFIVPRKAMGVRSGIWRITKPHRWE